MGSSIIFGDFSVNNNCSQDSTTRLERCLANYIPSPSSTSLGPHSKPVTEELERILDWLMHRSVDNSEQSTSVTSTIVSDNLCVISYLTLSVPRPSSSSTSFVKACNIRAINCTVLKDDLQNCLSGPKPVSAEDLDSHLLCVLEKHS